MYMDSAKLILSAKVFRYWVIQYNSLLVDKKKRNYGAFGCTNLYAAVKNKFLICLCDRRSVWTASVKEIAGKLQNIRMFVDNTLQVNIKFATTFTQSNPRSLEKVEYRSSTFEHFWAISTKFSTFC